MEDENIVQPEAEKTVEQVEEKIETPVAEQPAEPAPAAEPAAETPVEQPAPKRRGRKPKAQAVPAEEKPAEAPAAEAATEQPAAAPAKKRGRPRKNPAPAEEKPAEATASEPTPAKKRAPRAKKAPAPAEEPVEEVVEEEVSKVYTPEETVEIINKAIARKRSEVAAIQKSMGKAKRPSSIAEKQALVDYLNADINAYVSVVADMTDDDSLLEGIDTDAAPVEVPENYQKIYLDKLSVDDLENEQEAEELRADYCDGVIEDMCTSIGEAALTSKKMLKVLLDDPYALEIIGETIFYDDMLYDELRTIVNEKDEKAKKKNKAKKSGKKGKKK